MGKYHIFRYFSLKKIWYNNSILKILFYRKQLTITCKELNKKMWRVSEEARNWSSSEKKEQISECTCIESLPLSTVAKCQIWKWVLYAVEGDGEGGGVGRPGWKVNARLKQSLVCLNNPSIDQCWRSGQRTGPSSYRPYREGQGSLTSHSFHRSVCDLSACSALQSI